MYVCSSTSQPTIAAAEGCTATTAPCPTYQKQYFIPHTYRVHLVVEDREMPWDALFRGSKSAISNQRSIAKRSFSWAGAGVASRVHSRSNDAARPSCEAVGSDAPPSRAPERRFKTRRPAFRQTRGARPEQASSGSLIGSRPAAAAKTSSAPCKRQALRSGDSEGFGCAHTHATQSPQYYPITAWCEAQGGLAAVPRLVQVSDEKRANSVTCRGGILNWEIPTQCEEIGATGDWRLTT